MVGRQLPFFSLIVPFWLIAAYAGFEGHAGGLARAARRRRVVRDPAVPRLELSRSVAGRHRCRRVLDGALALFLRCWRRGRFERERAIAAPVATMPTVTDGDAAAHGDHSVDHPHVIVFAWGTPQVKTSSTTFRAPNIPIPGLDKMILRVPPVVPKPTPKPLCSSFNWLSATGRRFSSRRSSPASCCATRSARLARRY